MKILKYCRISTPYEGKDEVCVPEKCQAAKKYINSGSDCPYIELRIQFDPYIL